jgi:3-deoxy-D-manno-octulosonic-acid transferase
MGHSLGLALYNLTAGRTREALPDWPDRPDGRLVWLHAPVRGSVPALLELARRLIAETGVTILLTRPGATPHPKGMTEAEPPPDTPAAARAFLDHFRPDIAVMADGELRPALLHEASARRLPVILVDARTPYLPAGRKGWFPGLVRHLLSGIDQAIVPDDAAARVFARAGVPLPRLRAEGMMEEGSRALGCNEAERAALLRQLGTRPVWLAAGLPEAEEAAVIAAHRSTLRLAHRLLLVIVPEHPDRSDPLARQLEDAEGWTVARRSMEQEPEDETEVYLADAAAELGLWYRLAPITFLGGSLLGAGSLRDPYEPAALGSAILHGPHPGPWTRSFARLADARATRLVRSAGDLADAVGDLLSPDRAARMAQAAWAVSSAGAEVTDKVVAILRDRLAAGR